ncbi:MAG: hypothetical protein GW949_10695 [Spirochaetales bacterium]|nr:hypothetical protein [Spirochaetales bacterium]
MIHTCPYDHQHLPLPHEIQNYLEERISALLTGKRTAPRTTEELADVFVAPLIELLHPWVPNFRKTLEGRSILAQRISHQILEFLAQMIEDGNLTEFLSTSFAEVTRTDPRQDPSYPNLDLKTRVALRSTHRDRMVKVAFDSIRGIIRLAQRGLPRFLDKLLAAAEKYRQTEDRVRSATGTSSGLWDLEPGIWETREGNILQDTAEFLSHEPTIVAMLDTLGRRGLQDPRYTPKGEPPKETALGRQEIVGLELGRDLEVLLPSQLATLATTKGQGRFFAEYADGRLSQYAFRTRQNPSNSVSPTPEGRKESDLGPFVLCIDTSGSMDGLPEQAAKALSLAAVFRSIDQGRALVIVSFSDQTRVLEWSGERSLKEYLDFLGHSFRGGTDLRPALDTSIQYFRSGTFENGDLLIISDFRIPKIMVKKSFKLVQLQEHLGTRIHALTVGRNQIIDVYNMFDSRWIFCPDPNPFEPRLRETQG